MNSKWSGIMPDEIIYKAVVFNNKNGFELWKKWKPSNNVRLFNDLDYKYRECIYKAKKSYIIPLDDTNIKQTLSFVSMLNHLKLKQYSAQWILLEEKHNSYCDYYIFIRYDTLNKYSTDYIKKNISSIKGVQIFIYDRKNRVAAYAER